MIVMALSVVPSLFWPNTKILSIILPIAYLLVEQRVRNRPWVELGFNKQGIKESLGRNWWLILIEAMAIQIAVALLAKEFWPAFMSHLESRIPLFERTQIASLVVMMVFTTLGEEMAFRSLFQERLSWFVKPPASILAVSVLFGLMHWSPGVPAVIAVDLGLIVIDGIFFGLIFSRGKNLYVAWLTHFLANVVAVVVLFVV
jgi:membrane protease YdiL (CAAX protease family)